MCLILIPCENVYNDILGKSFLAALDEVAYTVYLETKDHNRSGETTIITWDSHTRLMHNTVLKNCEEGLFYLAWFWWRHVYLKKIWRCHKGWPMDNKLKNYMIIILKVHITIQSILYITLKAHKLHPTFILQILYDCA